MKLLLIFSILLQSILIANEENIKAEDKLQKIENKEKVEKVEKKAKTADNKIQMAEDKFKRIKAQLEEARAELEEAKLEAKEAHQEVKTVKNEAKDKQPNEPVESETAIVVLGDESGLSENQVREKAAELDNEEHEVDVARVMDTIVESGANGKINISKLQKKWKDQSPKAEKYDWVQTKSGEWFKGEIKTLYRDELLFDSDEIGLHTFDFEDIAQIKSYQVIGVNIDGVAIFEGIIRYKDEKITIIQGDKKYTYPYNQVVSLAPEGENEISHWSAKITASLDIRTGNSDQQDFSAKANIARLTSIDRLVFDYLGRSSEKNGEETSNDHRLNQKYDRFITRKFFWTPFFSELYKDKFKNINLQATGGVGIGYIITDTKDIEWDVSGGPAYIYTRYEEVEDSESKSSASPAFELSTKFKYDMTKTTDLIYSYKLTFTDSAAGTYKHHMLLTLENELTDWLDLDITYVWDYIQDPEKDGNGNVPIQDDTQLLIGLSVEF